MDTYSRVMSATSIDDLRGILSPCAGTCVTIALPVASLRAFPWREAQRMQSEVQAKIAELQSV